MKTRHYCLVAYCLLATSAALFAQAGKGLQPLGLAGKKVNALALARQGSASGPFFYAATSDSGIWRYLADTTWQSIGLKDKEISSLDIHVWGAGPALFHAPVAGVAPRFAQGDCTLVYRYESGKWFAADEF